MKKWVIFDAMGVIFEVGDDVGQLLVPYIRGLDESITPQWIDELYMQASLGQISPRTFWERLGLGKAYPQVEREYLDERLTLDEQFVGVARSLRREYRLAMLSNDIGEWSSYLREKHGLDELFDEVVISGDVQQRKPSLHIYETMLARMGCGAGECVFIDDNARNLTGAAALGMKTILFGSSEKTSHNGAMVDALSQLSKAVSEAFSEQ